MANCNDCVLPLLRGCPFRHDVNSTVCLMHHKSRSSCDERDCRYCRWAKYCREAGIILTE